MTIKKMNWFDVNNSVEYITQVCKDKGFRGVYGIPRGGLVLAVMLSHSLDIPLLSAPCKDCLIVDDVADTGKTLEVYRDKGYFIATMIYKEQSTVKPDVFWFECNEWIEFPWEVKYDSE